MTNVHAVTVGSEMIAPVTGADNIHRVDGDRPDTVTGGSAQS
ncbi:hypothetical protein [Massilia sp. DD77]